MTKREFLNEVIAVIDGTSEVNVLELKEFAKAEIVKLDERNASRSSKPTKAQIENEPIKEKILEVLSTGERMVASAIAEKIAESQYIVLPHQISRALPTFMKKMEKLDDNHHIGFLN